jgi:hypothetical protein
MVCCETHPEAPEQEVNIVQNGVEARERHDHPGPATYGGLGDPHERQHLLLVIL